MAPREHELRGPSAGQAPSGTPGVHPGGAGGPGALASSLASAPPLQAWLTEIQEHAQDDVVLMLLGNKVGTLASQNQVVISELKIYETQIYYMDSIADLQIIVSGNLKSCFFCI